MSAGGFLSGLDSTLTHTRERNEMLDDEQRKTQSAALVDSINSAKQYGVKDEDGNEIGQQVIAQNYDKLFALHNRPQHAPMLMDALHKVAGVVGGKLGIPGAKPAATPGISDAPVPVADDSSPIASVVRPTFGGAPSATNELGAALPTPNPPNVAPVATPPVAAPIASTTGAIPSAPKQTIGQLVAAAQPPGGTAAALQQRQVELIKAKQRGAHQAAVTKASPQMLKLGMVPETNEDGETEFRPMSKEELDANPVVAAQVAVTQAHADYMQAQRETLTDPDNPILQSKVAASKAKLAAAEAVQLHAERPVQARSGGGGAPVGNDASIIQQALRDGRLSETQLSGLGRNSPKTHILAEALKDPNYNPAQQAIQYGFLKSNGTQSKLASLGTLLGVNGEKGSLDQLLDLSNQIDRSRFPDLNKVTIGALKASGSPVVASYEAIANEAAGEVSAVLGGGGTGNGGSDFKLKQSLDVLNSNYSVDQLNRTVKEIKTLLGARSRALTQGNQFAPKSVGALIAPGAQAKPTKGARSLADAMKLKINAGLSADEVRKDMEKRGYEVKP